MSSTTYLLLVIALGIAYLLLKRAGQISKKDALEHLRNGAMVVDVRTPAEFNSGHLSQAVNLPLDEIEGLVPSRVRDKNKVLLLHCQSGVRSGIAKKRLASIGYTNAHNLGSYARAMSIVSGKRK